MLRSPQRHIHGTITSTSNYEYKNPRIILAVLIYECRHPCHSRDASELSAWTLLRVPRSAFVPHRRVLAFIFPHTYRHIYIYIYPRHPAAQWNQIHEVISRAEREANEHSATTCKHLQQRNTTLDRDTQEICIQFDRDNIHDVLKVDAPKLYSLNLNVAVRRAVQHCGASVCARSLPRLLGESCSSKGTIERQTQTHRHVITEDASELSALYSPELKF